MLKDNYEIQEYVYKHNDSDYASVIHLIDLPPEMELMDAMHLIRGDAEFGDYPTGCNHEHDCCGCWFRSGYDLKVIDHTQTKLQIMLMRSYSRNV